MRKCVHFLKEKGYRRIGYVDKSSRLARSEGRWQAAFEFETRNLIRAEALIDRPKERKQLIENFLGTFKPDALVIGSNQAFTALCELGFPVPFVVIDRDGRPDWVTGSETRYYDMGYEAARRVIDVVLGPQLITAGGRSLSLSHSWHVGTSHLSHKDRCP